MGDRKRISRSVVVALVASSAVGCADDAPTAVRDPRQSVVRIDAQGCGRPGRAVGIVIRDGVVATVAHATAGVPMLSVRSPAGDRHDAMVVAIDVAMDMALLSVPGLGLPAMELGEPVPGPARAVTFPDDRPVLSDMTVRRRVPVDTSDIYGRGEVRRPGLELAAAVVPGDSGGAIVAPDGRLEGVIWATSRVRDERGWATEVAALDPLLASLDRGDEPRRVRCP